VLRAVDYRVLGEGRRFVQQAGQRASTSSAPSRPRVRESLHPYFMLISVEPSSAFNSGDRAPQSTHLKRWPIMAQ
jgi:hypothetical protein